MVIYVRGEQLFLYADVDNRAEYKRISATDPDYLRWGDYMATLLDQPFDDQEPGIFAELEEKWFFNP